MDIKSLKTTSKKKKTAHHINFSINSPSTMSSKAYFSIFILALMEDPLSVCHSPPILNTLETPALLTLFLRYIGLSYSHRGLSAHLAPSVTQSAMLSPTHFSSL